MTALAVVQVEVLSTADPLQAGQRAAAIARRVRDEQRIAPAAAASIDPPTIRRHASVRSPKEVDRPLAIHWDADADLSTVCAARFPLKTAATAGACVVSLALTRRLSRPSRDWRRAPFSPSMNFAPLGGSLAPQRGAQRTALRGSRRARARLAANEA